MVEMNEWGCGLYSGAGNLLTFVSFCDKNMGVQIICSAGYTCSLENTVTKSNDLFWFGIKELQDSLTLFAPAFFYQHLFSPSNINTK